MPGHTDLSVTVADDEKIYIDGTPTQIISGTIHYFRIRPEQWADRIAKAKWLGLNTIETYCCHNLHEPEPGVFDFAAPSLHLANFLREVHAQGMYAIVRPGPYICAEWENGGHPSWMLTVPHLRMRCDNKPYLDIVDRYLTRVMEEVRPLLHTNGGPVILVQVENEYGSYGCDKVYLAHLRDTLLGCGVTVPLFTSDGPTDFMLRGGTLPDLMQTVNFGSRTKEAFDVSAVFRPGGPLFCMEFWNGWFDHWGEHHHTRDAESVVTEVEAMLSRGGSVNFYVLCGGTNFGFLNGANGLGTTRGDYAPTVTSYDYDSPLTEWGDPTDKFFACQAAIYKHRGLAIPPPPVPRDRLYSRKANYGGAVRFTGTAHLFEQLGQVGACHHSVLPQYMEHFGQSYGFILYRTHVVAPLKEINCWLFGLRDRATVYVDGRHIGTIYRNDEKHAVPMTIDRVDGPAQLDVLVENMGRINYGPQIDSDLKGLTGVGVSIQQQCNFDVWTLPLGAIDGLHFGAFAMDTEVPAFHRGVFTVPTEDDLADTFVEFPGVKGCVYINGFNLGRYWDVGPQKALYLPAPLLRVGENEIVVFELHKLNGDAVTLRDTPQLGDTVSEKED